jgi:hypothetical protein
METRRWQIGDCTSIEFTFHPTDHGFHRGWIGARPGGWRHHSRAEFPDDFFSDLGMRSEVCEIQLIKHQVGRLRSCVMAPHTVLVDQRTLFCNVRGG